ncbi:MAG: hypothetical protein U1E27_09520, partial [Kiritimatiellia bacterium]|nr:hypothetical protein [Kiritimatiellia bacterium]
MKQILALCLLSLASPGLAQTPAWRAPQAEVAVFEADAATAFDAAQWKSRAGWTAVTEAPHSVRGGCIIGNLNFALAILPDAESIRVAGFDGEALWVEACRISPNDESFPGRISEIRLRSLSPKSEARVWVTWTAGEESRTLDLTIPPDSPSLALRAGPGAREALVTASAEHLVAHD